MPLQCSFWFLGLGGGFGAGSLGLTPRSPGSGRYRATVESVLCLHLMDQLLEGLRAQNLYNAFQTVEMPSVVTLARMELNGMGAFHIIDITLSRRELYLHE